jgi:hypothetical protein
MPETTAPAALFGIAGARRPADPAGQAAPGHGRAGHSERGQLRSARRDWRADRRFARATLLAEGWWGHQMAVEIERRVGPKPRSAHL